MKRIRNAAMLAAILTFSGAGHAQGFQTQRTRALIEDPTAPYFVPNAHRVVDPEEVDVSALDYIQESRLNVRQREAQRDKARSYKELVRDLS